MNYDGLARKLTFALFVNQSFSSLGFIAVSTVASITGAALSGQDALAGLPGALYQGGLALTAFVWGQLMDRLGRRNVLVLGLFCGVMGAALSAFAILIHSFILFLCGMVLMGGANSAVQLSRFAAAEVNPPRARGRAISFVVLGGAVGSLLNYYVGGQTGEIAVRFGVDELVGPFALSLVLFLLGMIVIAIGLRPDPRDIGRELARLYPPPSHLSGSARPLGEIFRVPAAFVALCAMVAGQTVMIMLMVITSLHMRQHAHALSDIFLVMTTHTFGMFAFSIFSGWLADRWGRGPVIIAGSLALIFAALGATISPDLFPLAAALFLLGLGWNFCFVGGSSLLADQLSPAERARTQGFNDLLVGAASALGSLNSGFVFAAVGYNTMGIVAAAVAIVPLVLATWWQMTYKPVAGPQSSVASGQ